MGRLALQALQQPSGLAFVTPCAYARVRTIARGHKKLGGFNPCGHMGIQRYLHAQIFTRVCELIFVYEA